MPLAGSVTFPWVQASCLWNSNVDQTSLGFFRSSAPKINPEPVKIQEQLQVPDATEKTPADSTHTPGVAEQLTDGLEDPRPARKSSGLLNTLELIRLNSYNLLDEPTDPFDQSRPNPDPSWREAAGDIRRLAGYSSNAESIKIYFKHLASELWTGCSQRELELSKLYLRDICQCSKCVCPSSGQKTFATCDIPAVPRLRNPDTESIKLAADGGLEITWEDDFLTGDTHTSVYPLEFLNRMAEHDGRIYYHARPSPYFWDNAAFSWGMESRAITYDAWMEGGPEFGQAIFNLYTYGLVFMQGVPKSRDSVQRIAEKIGHLQSTIHGLTWDVISKPGAENVARTDIHKHLHQDLLYLRETPQLQFLHCLENERQGDLAVFSDGLHAARKLRRKDPSSYSALSTQSVTFAHQRAGQYFSNPRRVIQPGAHGDPWSIAWAPAFQAPFRISEHQKHRGPQSTPTSRKRALPRPGDGALRVWSRAARAFRDEAGSPLNMVAYKFRPGGCVIFDNTRVLHAWPDLDTSKGWGRRHLRGAYIDGQTLRSAYVRLAEEGLLTRGPAGMVFGPLGSGTL